MAEKELKAERVVCRSCKKRYDTTGLPPGSPFSCRRCGTILYAPGTRKHRGAQPANKRFGELALQMEYITQTQLHAALEAQEQSGDDRVRLGDILIQKGFVTSNQVSRILRAQGARIAHLIPGYEIVEKLGQGGMGAVYKGVHLVSGKTVAIKVLSDRLTRRPEFVERFHREARVAIDLDHPNIVKGFDEGAAADLHYFVMEYVHGKSTMRVVKKRGRFGEKRAMDIIRQIARALEYAHARNLVHRDIKPDNIMITREGSVKLADYGLVKYLDDIEAAGLTSEGQIMGTPNYISPEQASGRGVVDIRSDIYSLGASLFHLLTGKPPYEASNSSSILGMHVSSPVPDPAAINPTLSDEAGAIVRKMMAKKPELRFQAPTDLLVTLDGYMQRRAGATEGITPSGTSAPIPTGTGPALESGPDDGDDTGLLESVGDDGRELSRTAPLLFAAGVGVIVLGLAGTLVYAWKASPPSSAQQPGNATNALLDTAGEEQPASEDLPFDPVVTEISSKEQAAADLYKRAIAAEQDERLRLFRQIASEHPKTAAGRWVQNELARIADEQKQRAIEQREARHRQREQKAAQVYADAMGLAVESPARHRQALQAVVQQWPDTPAGAKARQRLARLAQQEQDERRRRQEEAAREREQKRLEEQRRQASRQRTIQGQFIPKYRAALSAFEFRKAWELCRELGEDPQNEGLEAFARACADDATALKPLMPAITAALLGDKSAEKTLELQNGAKHTGRVVSIKDGIVVMLINDRIPVHIKMQNLAGFEIERLFRAGYQEKNPPPDLVVALTYYALGDKEAARRLFVKLKKNDPRPQHHRNMLEW